MRGVVLFVLLGLTPGFAFAEDRAQTLADIRAELAAVNAEFTALNQELVTTGAAQSGAAGGDALQRMDALEAALVQLTSKTEAVEARLNKVVADGTNRVGDLEFRVCELTKGCDTSKLGTTATIGGATGAPAVAATEPAVGAAAVAAPELAVDEQATFDRAKGVLATGDFRSAADLFATFTTSYPGSPLSQEAHFQRGEALAQVGDTKNSARAYLDAFTDAKDGPRAGEALLKLGKSLGTLGQTPEACVTLTEVGVRFPGSADATNAQAAMQGLACQ